ncbi:MAG TPA: hypothetical protein VMT30_00155 [Candidatus Saccharimonadia bacterium]|nr:hypothetical protein [Candidatus Saccharimonadia bacterium]
MLTNTGAVVADGNYNLRFKIYQDGPGNVAGDTGGTLKWTELWQNSVASGSSAGVVVKNGYFSATLGTYCAFSGGSCQGNTNTAIDFNQDTLWLSMDVGGTAVSNTPTYDGELLPMKRLSSAVYALQADNAGKLGGLTSGQFVQLAQGVQTDSSTSNPSIGINKTGGTADIINLQRGAAVVLQINNAGQTVFRPSTDSVAALVVQKAGTTTNILTVDTSNNRVGVNLGTANPQATFEVNGGAIFSAAGSNLTSYAAVTGGIPSTLAVSKYAVAAGAAVIATGLTGAAADHGTGLSVFDARTNSNLWPAIALWSQSENRLAGFSWEGGSSTAYFKTSGGDLALKSDATTLLTASASDLSVNIQASGAYKIGGTTVCSGTVCTPAAGSGNYIQNSTGFQNGNFALVNNGSTSADTAVIKQSTSQTGYLLRVQNSGATVDYLTVSAATGTVGVTGAAGGSQTALNVATNVASNTGVVIQGASSQTADFLQVQDSTGATIGRVNAGGDLEMLGIINSSFGGIGKSGNGLLYSEQFDNAVWTKTNVTTPVADTDAAPNTSTTAESLADSSPGGLVSQPSTLVASGSTFIFSVWLKTTTGTQAVDLRIDGSTLGTGTKTTVTATTTWQRFSVTQNGTGFTGNMVAVIFPGGTAGSGTVRAWGAQLWTGSTVRVYSRTIGNAWASGRGVVTSSGLFVSDAASNAVLVVQGAVSQSGDLFQAQNSAGTTLAKVSAAGALTAVGVNAGTGLIQGTGGLTVTGAVSLTGTATGGIPTVSIDMTNSDTTGFGVGARSTLTTSPGSANSATTLGNGFIAQPASGGSITYSGDYMAAYSQVSWQGSNVSTGRLIGFAGKTIVNSGTGAVTNAIGILAENTLSSAVTNSYVLKVADNAGSVAPTNAYGVYVDNLTSGTNRYPLYLAGSSKILFDVNSSGQIGVNLPTASVASADLTFGEGSTRAVNVLTRTTNAAGNALTVTAGAGGSGATGVAGGSLTLAAGAAAGTTGNANGGDVLAYGGAKVNSGTDGNILLAYNGSIAVGKVGIGTGSPSRMLEVDGTALVKVAGDAFEVQDGGGLSELLVDTSNDRVYVGNRTPDTVGAVLVLDTKTVAVDPSGLDGAMYYNSGYRRMRCYYDSSWRFCNDPAGLLWGFNIEEEFVDGGRNWNSGASGTSSSSAATGPDLATRIGQFSMITGTTTTGKASVWYGSAGPEQTIVGGGEEMEFAVNIPTVPDATNDYDVYMGLCDSQTGACTDGMYFKIDRAVSTTKWVYAVAKGGSVTETASTTSFSAGWHHFKVWVHATNNIEYFVDDVSIGSIASATNVPTGTTNGTEPSFSIIKQAGTVGRALVLDYFQYRNTFTAAR